MPQAVYVIWVIVLIVAVLVLPIIVFMLHRTLRAALNIARYMKEMRIAGEGVATNTSHITALNATADTGGTLLETAIEIQNESATIEEVLSTRAARYN